MDDKERPNGWPLIHDLWRTTEPSDQAQHITRKFRTLLNGTQASDQLPEGVWWLIDVAAQQAFSEGRKACIDIIDQQAMTYKKQAEVAQELGKRGRRYRHTAKVLKAVSRLILSRNE